jgi:hypothetical protein
MGGVIWSGPSRPRRFAYAWLPLACLVAEPGPPRCSGGCTAGIGAWLSGISGVCVCGVGLYPLNPPFPFFFILVFLLGLCFLVCVLQS